MRCKFIVYEILTKTSEKTKTVLYDRLHRNETSSPVSWQFSHLPMHRLSMDCGLSIIGTMTIGTLLAFADVNKMCRLMALDVYSKKFGEKCVHISDTPISDSHLYTHHSILIRIKLKSADPWQRSGLFGFLDH